MYLARIPRITTQETRQKLSEAGKRRKHSTETIKKISEGNAGKTLTIEHRRKIAESWKLRRLIPVSLETRRKLSEASSRAALNPSFDSSLEKKVRALLTLRGVDNRKGHVQGLPHILLETPLRTRRLWYHTYDLVLDKYKVIIEVDGCRVHGCERCQHEPLLSDTPEIDTALNTLVKNTGWKMVRLKEHDMATDESILNFLRTSCPEIFSVV